MPEPVRIAIFGNSHAQGVQLPALAHIGHNQVIGIAGMDAQKAQATADRFGFSHATTDWRELLELEPDLVMVTTPVDLHAEMVRTSLHAGAVVLCEKPFTHRVEDAEELSELARGRLALVDFQLRFNPYRIKMRELCHAGFVGDVQQIQADLVLETPTFAGRPFTWWSQAERGGGALGAIGSHMIDGIEWMFGSVSSVWAKLTTLIKKRLDAAGVERDVTSDDLAEVWLELESGARAAVTVSLALRGEARWFVEVSGSQGTLRLEREEKLTGCQHGEQMTTIPVEQGWQPPETYGIQGRGPFAAMNGPFLRAVIDAVARGDSQLPGAATFDDGLANVRVLEAARESSSAGGIAIPG
ncbi:MAG: Gfo/Idh/MocA family oxidoreductase [Planctomycetota bacterium]|nr:Gfo/Idh/MocA family oxidoreductase [Planctomycetota bacterium]